MGTLDGHYRHLGSALTWDATGVTWHPVGTTAVRLTWAEVRTVRRRRSRGESVELFYSRDAGPESPWLDSIVVPVSTSADADRLLTTLAWRLTDRQHG